MLNGEGLRAAWQSRAGLRGLLAQEETDCYRLFHGAVEGTPGLTIDVYGSLVLVQCHREAPDELQLPELWKVAQDLGLTGMVVWQRLGSASTIIFEAGDLEQRWVHEFGLEYAIQPRPRRLDPQLFLDMRSVRRRILNLTRPGSTVLNLFCYSGSLGIAAHKAGASQVWQVDFSKSALELARGNAQRNGFADETYVCEDIYPVIWQLAGRQVKRRRGDASPRSYVRLEPQKFDLVVLDPPQRSKGHYGAVDIKNDYTGLFRPCLEILADGGSMIVTNNLAEVKIEDFQEQLQRCANKYARPWKSVEVIVPEEDFPSSDGRPPLKILQLSF